MKKKRWLQVGVLVLLLVQMILPVRAYDFFSGRVYYPARAVTSHPRILMVGNSLTYTNNIPGLLQAMCASSGIDATVESVTVGGYSLTQYVFPGNDWEQSIHQRLMSKLQNETWDYVILQGMREEPLWKETTMRQAIGTLYPLIQKSGAQMVLYMTWAADFRTAGYDMDQVQAKVSDVYCSLARQYSCALAPSGIAFARERKFYPDYDLYVSQSDRVHPNLSGSYLSACCIYATLFEKNPENLSYTAGLPLERAKILQALAADVTTRGTGTSSGGTVVRANAAGYQLKPGEKKQLSYTATTNDIRAIRYTSSNTRVAEVNATGKISANTAGTATVTAELNNGKTLTWQIVVSDCGKLKLSAGSQKQLDFDDSGYSWKTSNKKVAGIKNGVITAGQKGTAVLTGKSTGGVTATISVTVTGKSEKFAVKNAPKTLAVGKKYQLKLSPSNAKATYQSSKSSVVSVSKKGVLQARKAGTAKITIKSSTGKKVTFQVTARVLTKKLTVTNMKSGSVMCVGQKKRIKVSFMPKNVSNKKLTYQSSNKKVIRIDKKGMLQAVKPGTARITVMAADGSKKKVVVKIVVKR